MAKFLHTLGGFAARKSWVVIGAWLVILLALGGAFAAFKGELSNNITIPGTKAAQVQDDLSGKFDVNSDAGQGQAIVSTEDGGKITDQQKQAVADTLKKVDDVQDVDSTMDPFAQQKQVDEGRQKLEDAKQQLTSGTQQLDAAQKQLDGARSQIPANAPASATRQLDEQQATLDQKRSELESGSKDLDRNERKLDLTSDYRTISEDGTTALTSVTFTKEINEISPDTLAEIRSIFQDADLHGLNVEFDQNLEGMHEMGVTSEIIGMVIALIVLLIMLGTFVAAGLPILMAVVGVGGAYLGAFALSNVVDMNSSTPALGSMLGLAVGIDYSLFIINRHRNNLSRGMGMKESIALATGTSGNAVLFAGTTVIIALLALNVVGIPFLSVMGNVAAFAVLMAVAVAVSLTPAMLGIIGHRIVPRRRWEAIQRRTRLREQADHTGAAGHTADRAHALHEEQETTPRGWLRVVLKSPVVTILATVAVLGIIAIPMGQLRLGLPDGGSQSKDSGAYKTYQIVQDKFGAGRNGPVIAAAYLPDGTTKDQAQDLEVDLGEQLRDQQNVAAVVPAGIAKDNSMLLYQVIPEEGPSAESTTSLVNDLRALKLDTPRGEATFGVTGQTAMNIDISENLLKVLPVYLGIVVGLSLIVLILVFRSIWVPLTATVGFLFSLLAAFGATVAVFQWGWAGSLFNVTQPGPILSFLPILAVGILFGLAMDYQMFLVSAMREAFSHGRDGKTSVVVGYSHSARVVVAAALIMTGVFMGFVFSGDPMIASIGFVLSAGVLFDAFVVRMTLIPAVMHLLGDRAWWFPRWLDRIVPDVDVEGASLERSTHGRHGGAGSAA
ncbi:MMPL family transporter [Kocuria sp.]|uniref:MMPL family transporter n=1 Tax=Kocuria sp. TaxID=1871328 RepID=UPI0026DBB2A4|nr:MMPL family transporter [Kocuria sp.]MDO4918970.1 MMPL family transporter [Kocuria sp.]